MATEQAIVVNEAKEEIVEPLNKKNVGAIIETKVFTGDIPVITKNIQLNLLTEPTTFDFNDKENQNKIFYFYFTGQSTDSNYYHIKAKNQICVYDSGVEIMNDLGGAINDVTGNEINTYAGFSDTRYAPEFYAYSNGAILVIGKHYEA